MIRAACLFAALVPTVAAQSYGSANISHPLVFSIGMGSLSSIWLSDFELGLGGAKLGFGLGALRMQGGQGGGLALKLSLMRVWKSPLDSPWEDTSVVLDNPFPTNNNYAGLELVVSPIPYRLAIGAYRPIGKFSVSNLEDAARDVEKDDIVWGLSLGLGF